MQHTTTHKHYTQQQQQIQSQPTLQTIFYDFRDCLCFSRFIDTRKTITRFCDIRNITKKKKKRFVVISIYR